MKKMTNRKSAGSYKPKPEYDNIKISDFIKGLQNILKNEGDLEMLHGYGNFNNWGIEKFTDLAEVEYFYVLESWDNKYSKPSKYERICYENQKGLDCECGCSKKITQKYLVI